MTGVQTCALPIYVYFDMLAEIIDNAIDDARWMAADITVLDSGESCTLAA